MTSTTLEVFMAVKIQVELFWVLMSCNDVVHYQHFSQKSMLSPSSGWRGSMDLWKAGILPQHYTASQPRRTQPEFGNW